MTLTLLGANGMLGSDLLPLLKEAGHEVRVYDRPDFDITSESDLAAALAGADAIINCAAYTNVDGAESEPDLANAVNGHAVGLLGRLAAQNGQYVVHISTDFVYDGLKPAPYTEADAPNPLNVYGASKWLGEQQLLASGAAHATLRIQWTYGVHGRHFITKICELARTRPSLKVVDDQIGSPTPTTAVAETIRRLLDRRVTGTFLYAANGYATRYEVACFAARQLGLQVEIVPCESAEFPAPAHRPLNSRFHCAKLDQALGFERPSWQDYLTTYLEQQP